MKKLLYLFPSIKSGGAEKTAILIANELIQKEDYQISFFICDDSCFFIPIIDSRIKLIQLNLSFDCSYFKKIWRKYFVVPFRLNELLKISDYDIVISIYEHDAEIPIIIRNILFHLRFKSGKIRSVSVIQNSLKGKSKYFHLKRRVINRIIDRLRRYFFDFFIVVSSHIGDELKRFGINGYYLVHNPIDINTIDNKMVDEIAPSILTSIGQNYILCIARIAQQKNIIFLLKAFRSIVESGYFNLVILGEISEPDYYYQVNDFIAKNNLLDRVKYLGSMVNPYPLIKNAKYIVNTSLYEGFPLSILEAMYLEVPILSTNFIGYGEILTPLNSAISFSNNEIEFGKMMLKIYEKPSINLSANKLIAIEHSLSIIANNYDSIFRLS